MSVQNSAAAPAGAFFRFQPAPVKKRLIWRTIMAVLATLAGMASVTILLLNPPEILLKSAARPVQQPSGWVDIVKPFQLYGMPSALFGSDPRQFTARRHLAHGGRIDSMSFGADAPGPGHWLHIEIRRFGSEGELANEPEIPLYAEMTRQAAQAGGSIARYGLPQRVDTRFGPLEMADLQIAAGDRMTSCTGFRLTRQPPGLGFAGLACGTAARQMDRQAVLCAIDRLDLIASGDDRELGDFFARRELRRGRECATSRIGRVDRPDWLAPAIETASLKGSLAAAPPKRP